MNHGASVEHKINQNSRPMIVETLAVFGATGQTGQHVVEYALEICLECTSACSRCHQAETKTRQSHHYSR
jgi:hypothetical protein